MRLGRGLAAASIAVFVAAFSHVAAGGGAPGGVGLALSLAFAAIVCVALTRRRPSVTLLSISVLISQFVFHLLFGVGDRGASGLMVSTVSHGSHVSAVLVVPGSGSGVGSGGGAGSGVPVAASGHLHDSAWMWVAHAVAAVLTIVLIRRGELVLRRLRELARVCERWTARDLVAWFARRLDTAGVLSVVAAVTGAALERRRTMRSTSLPSVDGLRDLGAVFERLRHRGPPEALSMRCLT